MAAVSTVGSTQDTLANAARKEAAAVLQATAVNQVAYGGGGGVEGCECRHYQLAGAEVAVRQARRCRQPARVLSEHHCPKSLRVRPACATTTSSDGNGWPAVGSGGRDVGGWSDVRGRLAAKVGWGERPAVVAVYRGQGRFGLHTETQIECQQSAGLWSPPRLASSSLL